MNLIDDRESAADLAAYAAFFEMAEALGLSGLLDGGRPFTLDEVTEHGRVDGRGAVAFTGALLAAGLLEPGSHPREFVPGADMAGRRYRAGYVSWSLTANRPYLDHAAEILRDPATAAGHSRDGRKVAVSSRWIGTYGFYPGVVEEILSRKPQRIVDLGAGAGALLVRLLTELPNSTGVALDLSAGACAEATAAAGRAGVGDRLDVVHRPIESLVEDASPVRDADVVHAGFVLHDTLARPEVAEGVLRACRESLAPGGTVIVTDAVPYASGAERAFSALFTYLHASSMNVELPSGEQWRALFRRAGFAKVTSTPLGMPGSRMMVASR
ncbi:class I SAM-dependent methyltransferase [Amycolatopsis sp. CA-126428]|uniref:class I SAM-dependent methyltransferase n=1 Tax=Amycolatopsis sp. CA-126428 TaxID=2073158 RepID=UPI000CD292B8|nr:class I SAM-dependent methyltransferase [Amycolatopsis sp. CA-126428]